MIFGKDLAETKYVNWPLGIKELLCILKAQTGPLGRIWPFENGGSGIFKATFMAGVLEEAWTGAAARVYGRVLMNLGSNSCCMASTRSLL